VSGFGVRSWVLAARYGANCLSADSQMRMTYFVVTSECVMACTESAMRFCTPTLRISLAT